MKKKIALIVILIILLLIGGIAYAYYATDLFKTDKEMFFSYLVDEKTGTEFNQEKLLEYYAKQASTPYENNGEISFYTTGMSESQGLNEVKIAFEGKTVNSQKAFEQEVTLDLSQGYTVPINLKRDRDMIGVQADILGEDRYIAIRNENLKELAERFGIDAEYIPEKIEYNTFTEKELKQLEDKYYQFLDERLTDDMFSKEKENGQTVVKLNMSAEKFLEIISELMKTISEDEIINSKLPENFMETFKDTIQNFQDDIERQTYSEEDRFEMKIYIEKRQTKKMEIKFLEEDGEPMNITAEFAENTMALKCYEEGELLLEQTISMQANENDVTYAINYKTYESTDEEAVEINVDLTYKNLMQLDNIQEEFTIEIKQNNASSYSSYYYDYEDEPEESTINIKYTNQNTFLQKLELNSLDQTNAIILNDATDEEIQNVFYNMYKSFRLM